MIFAFLLPLAILLALAIEALIFRRFRNAVPLRIHVNGTRGKSTVVRYTVAGLRAGGFRTMGKITGVLPTMLLPDGTEQTVVRRGAARVQEQVRMTIMAGRLGCDALVLECMSIDPILQRFESDHIRPAISVITNARPDHEEASIPRTVSKDCVGNVFVGPKGVLISTGNDLQQFRRVREPLELRTTAASDVLRSRKTKDLPAAQMQNVELALAVCVEAGIEKAVALKAILEESTSCESAPVTWKTGAAELSFIDGFAVNEVESASMLLDELHSSAKTIPDLYIILNTRSDRPLRTRQFVRWLVTRQDVNGVIVCGTHREYCQRALQTSGFPRKNITRWDDASCRTAPEQCAGISVVHATFVGLMNVGGTGFVVRDAFRKVMIGRDRDGH